MVADNLIDALVRTVDGVVTGIDVAAGVANMWANMMAGSEFVTFSASLADILLF